MRSLAFLFLALVLFSCKKDEDTVVPAIEITAPYDGIQYTVGDTMHITIEVADDVELDELEVKLTNQNLVAVMQSAVFDVSGESRTLSFDYVLDDVTLASGQYYIHATVHDAARNNSKDFVSVNITEIPLALKGVFAVTTMPGFVSLYSIDTSWTATGYGVFSGDFTDLAVNSWWQQVTFTGSVSGLTRCISIDGAHAGWTLNPFPSTGAYWGNVLSHDRDWLINYRSDGVIKKMTWNATISENWNANSGHFFRNFVYSGEKLYADMIDAPGTSRLLGVYLPGGGGAVQQTVLNADPVALLPRDETTIYIACNQGGQGKLLIYDYDLNGTWEPVALPAGELLSAAPIDANTLLLAMDNGNIYTFTYSPVGVIAWNAVTAQHVRYDAAGGTVITGEGTYIRQYAYPQTTLLDQIPMGDTVRDVELWYNR